MPTEANGDAQPYKVKIVYTFESEELRKSLLPKIENLGLIHKINHRYEQSGQILSFTHEQYENLVSNVYVFDSEKSYLEWEAEMVLAKVMDQKYCGTKVVQRGDSDLSYLGETGIGLNKRMLVEVRSPDKAST